jgi:O-antigen/teichoic acid export membrane protein
MSTIPDQVRLRHGEALVSPRTWLRLPNFSHGVGVIVDQGVVSLASFLTTAIVGRFCGDHELGVFSLAVSSFWLAAGIPNSLVWTPYTARGLRLTADRQKAFAGSALIHATVIGIGFAVASIAFAVLPHERWSGSEWLGPMCLALAPLLLFMTIREHVRRYNLAHLRSGDLLSLDVPIAICQLALLVGLVTIGRLSAVTALLAIAASSALTIAWLIRRQDQFTFDRARTALHWFHNQLFGRWLLVVSLMWLVGDSSYRWLVAWLHGTSSLGQFAAAQNIVLVLNPILLTVTNLTQSLSVKWLADGGHAELRTKTTRTTLLLAVWSGAALLGVALVGGPLVQTVFGESYHGLGSVVATLCLGMFARIVAMPADSAIVALKRGRVLVSAAMLRLIVIVGAGAPLIAATGLDGVGYAMAASAASGGVLQWWSLLRGGNHAKR